MKLDEVDKPERGSVTIDQCPDCEGEFQYPCGPPRDPGTCPRSDCEGSLIRTKKIIR